MGDFPKLYVGTQNDALFIIDQPPRPAPVDCIVPGNPRGVNVIAKMCISGQEGDRLANVIAAAPDLLTFVEDTRDCLGDFLREFGSDYPDDIRAPLQSLFDRAKNEIAKAEADHG